MEAIMNLILTAILLIAVVTDLQSQRIPNWLTFPAMALAITHHTMTQGVEGLLFSLAGFGLGLGVMLIPFLIGVMGAGDVKLMAAAGAFLGASVIFHAFLLTSFAGGGYALIMLARKRGLLTRIFHSASHSVTKLITAKELSYAPQTTDTPMPRLCYGVAIAIGTLTSMYINFGTSGFIPALPV